ncbi:MAG: hypothetical protein GKS03_07100 [Alphaproteobacteria bacterium]|nr:hypothetical protein [Alphaproteobacteria bacterium]
MSPKQIISLLVASVGAAVLSGCALEPVPPCPEIRIDSNTASLTTFQQGSGRDVSDIEYQAEIVSFEGTCKFDDDGVEAVMDIDMIVSGGPAVKPRTVDLYYFVAIPRFFPDPVGKKIFTRKHRIRSGGARQERITESSVRIFLPLEDRLTAAGYDIYLGFQLTDEQLRYNRSRTR